VNSLLSVQVRTLGDGAASGAREAADLAAALDTTRAQLAAATAEQSASAEAADDSAPAATDRGNGSARPAASAHEVQRLQSEVARLKESEAQTVDELSR
jgi:hypothetical protein